MSRKQRSKRQAAPSATYGAQAGLSFLEPRFSRVVHELVRLASPLYLRFGEGVAGVELEGEETLRAEFSRFFAGDSRLIVAFRHPSVSDAPLLSYLFAHLLPRRARRGGRPFGRPSHVHFLYGRGVPVWAGRPVGWILPRVAAIPVYHRRLDSRGMSAVREAAVNGRFPLALAPEGQVTYHNKAIGPLEAGTGRIALWCADDLRAAGRQEDVRVLPLSLEYRYPRNAAGRIDHVLSWIREKTGLSGAGDYGGLLELTGKLLSRIEELYETAFPSHAGQAPGATDPGATDPGALTEHIRRLCDTALRAGERTHGLSPRGMLLDRVFRLRDAGWRRIFRDGIESFTALERSVADAAAEQARIAARHMELVDVLEYLDPDYIGPDSPAERLLEYALNLQDIVNRVLGGTIAGRMQIPGRTAVVSAGRAVSVSELTGGSRRGRSRDAASRITAYVREEFTRLMGPATRDTT